MLRTVYFAIFDSVLRYGIQILGQHRSQAIKETEKKLRKKSSELLTSKIEPKLQIH